MSEPTITYDQSGRPIWVKVTYRGRTKRYPAATMMMAEIMAGDVKRRLLAEGAWPKGW